MYVCAAASGAFPKCVSPFGAYDMAGNVEEWVSTTTHRGTGIFKGGYFMHVTVNGLGCDMITTAHAQWYHDYRYVEERAGCSLPPPHPFHACLAPACPFAAAQALLTPSVPLQLRHNNHALW